MKHIFLFGIILIVATAAFAEEPSIESTFFEGAITQPASSTASPVLSEKDIEELIDLKLQSISSGLNSDGIVQQKVENEFWYVIVLSCLSLISLFIVLQFLKGQEGGKNMVSASGLTLIIYGTIILVLIVDTTEQLTAAIGILGAIAGYLFRSVQGEFTPSRKYDSVVSKEMKAE